MGEVEETTADILASGQAVPVVVCGRNDTLRARLAAAGHPHVLGWVENMADLVRVCDVVVQNAGGLSASEALASGVPVLTYRCLSGHGRPNAAALDADGSVPWLAHPDDLAQDLAFALAKQTTGHENGPATGRVGVVSRCGRDGGAAMAAVADAGSGRAVRPRSARRDHAAALGTGDPGHVALTFDDGPHPGPPRVSSRCSTGRQVRATFFVLGRELARRPWLGRRSSSEGTRSPCTAGTTAVCSPRPDRGVRRLARTVT